MVSTKSQSRKDLQRTHRAGKRYDLKGTRSHDIMIRHSQSKVILTYPGLPSGSQECNYNVNNRSDKNNAVEPVEDAPVARQQRTKILDLAVSFNG